MKKVLLAAMLLFSLATVVSAQKPATPQHAVTYIYVTIHGTDANDVSAKVQAKLTDGYEIVSALAQSVSTSVNSRTNTDQAYSTPYRDIKGELVYVLRKKN